MSNYVHAKIISGPADTAGVTLAEVKNHIPSEKNITANDAFLTGAIIIATEWVSNVLGRQLFTTGYRMVFRGEEIGKNRFNLFFPPVTAVSEIGLIGEDGVDYPFDSASWYEVLTKEPQTVVIKPELITIDTEVEYESYYFDYTAGYGADESTVPPTIKGFINNHVAIQYSSRTNAPIVDGDARSEKELKNIILASPFSVEVSV